MHRERAEALEREAAELRDRLKVIVDCRNALSAASTQAVPPDIEDIYPRRDREVVSAAHGNTPGRPHNSQRRG
jgi:hypothetical protein